MFQINAVLNPSVIDDVVQGLHDEKIHGITITNVVGKGCFNKENKLIEKVLIVIVVADTIHKEKAMEAIRANAQDIEHGTGKMWVTPVLEVERIRTGEKDLDALSFTTKKEVLHSEKVEVFSSIDTPSS
ncbi:P-II family nitrogen regulator [Candidatus Sulfurimonas marisnigri]|uniref:P-II family nitrogen regulator n=1 Tax=Candidatus Sulfurimonas marisnigri TaxID=2740405 RepID=A0A7S7RRB4_9BACT|nr:P-II family nitrogen regulator [Candidatus Sulfurimonas marisnigri]QOY55365.1 P-II family nitrogen regulator [Candidatus Sulfurimonas marisnigri]